jgi:hypothetical protein
MRLTLPALRISSRRSHRSWERPPLPTASGSKRGSGGGSARGSKRGSKSGSGGSAGGSKRGSKRGSGGSTRWSKSGSKCGSGGGSSIGSRGERIAGLLGLVSVFLEVFYCGGSFYGCAVYRELVLLNDIYLALMCAHYMLALTSAIRVCSHVCHAVCYLPAVCCFRPPGMGVCGHAVRVAFLLSHGPHTYFRVLTFLKRPTRGPRTPSRGSVATQFFFPDDGRGRSGAAQVRR